MILFRLHVAGDICPYLDEKISIYFLNHFIISGCDYQVLNYCYFFQRIVFGQVGHLGLLVQNLAGAEVKLDLAPRLRLNAMVEFVQDLEVTAKLAIDNLVQVSKIRHLLYY